MFKLQWILISVEIEKQTISSRAPVTRLLEACFSIPVTPEPSSYLSRVNTEVEQASKSKVWASGWREDGKNRESTPVEEAWFSGSILKRSGFFTRTHSAGLPGVSHSMGPRSPTVCSNKTSATLVLPLVCTLKSHRSTRWVHAHLRCSLSSTH